MYKVKLATMLLVLSISIINSSLNAWGVNRTAPRVVLTVPDNGETGVVTDQKVNVTFNEPMNPSKINQRTFRVTQEGSTTRVLGITTFSEDNQRVSFEPRQPFARDTQYIVRIKGANKAGPSVRDTENYAMKNDYVWTFRTGPNLSTDSISPTVSFTAPSNGANSVVVNSKVVATFSEVIGEAVNSSTVAFSLSQGSTPVLGTVSYSGKTATFTPASNLIINSTYIAKITTQVRDLAGNPLTNSYVWSFTTGPDFDNVSPVVQLISPINGSTGVATNRNFAVAFNEVIDPLTVTTTSFMLKQGTTAISGTVSYFGVIATFNPTSDLAPNSTYTATVTTQVRDLAGNPLASDFVWSFTTGNITPSP